MKRWPTHRLAVSGALLALTLAAGTSPGAAAYDAAQVETALNHPWTGDFDGMVERHRIRALVAHSATFYFLDGGQQRGVTYELLEAFEKKVNEDLKKRTIKVEVVFIPVTRDRIFQALVDGRGDIAASNLTDTPGRRELVDFSEPIESDVSEVVVTGPRAAALASVDDLSGKEIHVRKSSSYHESLVKLNESLRAAGKPAVDIVLADERLESEDLLEMVNAGHIPMTVVDRHVGEFWAQVFEHITLHPDIAVRTGGKIAWAYRKGSPQLAEVVNAFVRKNRQGTLLGNIVLKRYLANASYVKRSLSDEEVEKFHATADLFKKYAARYEFDWLLATAVGYQESQLDQSKRSAAGAIGVMQMLPSTAKDPSVGIPDIHELEPNIHAGVKYLKLIHDTHFDDEGLDQVERWFFTCASYNAGPAKVASLRREAKKMGLDPNVWFDNVEVVAARRIGRETVQYVSNIYKYYLAYKLLHDEMQAREAAKRTSGG